MSSTLKPVYSEEQATADEDRASVALIATIQAQVRQLEQQEADLEQRLADLTKQAQPPAQKP
jgi:uncharacterized protein YceH (UPF0502 family)